MWAFSPLSTGGGQLLSGPVGDVTETATALDVQAATVDYAVAQTETDDVVESSSSTYDTSSSATESAPATETQEYPPGSNVPASQTETDDVTETQTGQVDFTSARTETVTATETETSQADFVSARTETNTATESETVQVDFVSARTETNTATESETVSSLFVSDRTETATATEAQTNIITADKSITESAQRTNLVRNSTMAGATVGVIGSGGAIPTNWFWGASSTLTREVVALGTNEFGEQYIDLRISGTNTSGGITYPDIYPVPTGTKAAVVGETYTFSIRSRIIAGSRSGFLNTTSQTWAIAEWSSVWLAANGVVLNDGFGSVTRTISDPAVTSVAVYTDCSVPNGGTVDMTLRISVPQFEYGTVASEFIPTSGTIASAGAGTRQYGPVSFVSSRTEANTATESETVQVNFVSDRTETVTATETETGNYSSNQSITEAALRTNLTSNGNAVGTVNGILGSGGAIPTAWVNVQQPVGISYEIIGSGTESGISYFDLRIFGSTTTNHPLLGPNSVNNPFASTQYTMSCWVKKISGNCPSITFGMGGNTGAFDNVGTFAPTTSLARYSGTGTTGSTVGVYLVPWLHFLTATDGTAYDFTVRIGGFQTEIGAVASEYIPTTNAIASSGAGTTQNGIGAYEATRTEAIVRTNLLTYSSDYTQAIWSKTQTYTITSGTAPDGSASSIITNTGASPLYIYRPFDSSYTNPSGTIYTMSGYVKNVPTYTAVISNAGISQGAVVGGSQGVEYAGNNWYRHYVSWQTNTNNGTASIQIRVNVGETIEVWGAQTEVSSVPTEYIPTTSTTASAGIFEKQTNATTFVTTRTETSTATDSEDASFANAATITETDDVVESSTTTLLYGGVATETATATESETGIANLNAALTEAALRTNYVRNSSVGGAVIGVLGSGGSLPSLWTHSITAGMTREIVGTGTNEFGEPYFDVRLYGTNSGGAVAYSSIWPSSTLVPAAVGEIYTFSIRIKTIAGSRTGFSSGNGFTIAEWDSVSTWLAGTFTSTQENARTSGTRTISNASVSFTQPYLEYGVNPGATVDLTVRISIPQFERGSTATEYIPTTNAIASSGAGTTQRNTANLVASATESALRTNYIPNSTMVGAGVGVLPTGWMALTTQVGITASVVGTGTDSGFNYIDVRFNGTSTGGGGGLRIMPVASSTSVAAVDGESFAGSVYVKLMSGTLLTGGGRYLRNQIYPRDSGGVAVASPAQSNTLIGLVNSSTFVRSDAIGTFSGVPTLAYVQPMLEYLVITGDTIDFTLRVAAPQLERGLSVSEFIPTSGTIASAGAGTTQANTLLAAVAATETVQRTNYVPNSTMVGGVGGTPGTGPTSWAPALPAWATRTLTYGVDSLTGYNYIEATFTGTNNTGALSEVSLDVMNPTVQAGAYGQTWCASSYMALLSGSFPSGTGSYAWFGIKQRNSAGTDLGAFYQQQLTSLLTGTMQRITSNALINNTTVAYVQVCCRIAVAIGETINFTVRMAAPQLEYNVTAPSAFIPTSGTIVTVSPDSTQSNITTFAAARNELTKKNLLVSVNSYEASAWIKDSVNVLSNLTTYSQDFNAVGTSTNAFLQTNILTYTEDFSNAYWSKSNLVNTYNATTAPDGTQTATLFKNTPSLGSNFSRSITWEEAVYTRSIFVKPDGSGNSSIYFEGVGGSGLAGGQGGFIGFNAVTKTFNGNTSNAIAYGYTEYQNGWMRVYVTGQYKLDLSQVVNVSIYIGAYGATATQHGVYMWGYMLYKGYDTDVPYQRGAGSSLPITYVAPDGSSTAYKLIEAETASAVIHEYQRGISQTTTASVGQVFTTSVYVKADERYVMRMQYLSTVFNAGRIVYDLANGVILQTGANVSGTITGVGNGWYRITMTSSVVTPGSSNVYISTCNNTTTDIYVGSSANGFLMWGLQVTYGADAGQYTRTFTSSLPLAYTAPDGTLTARKIYETTAASTHAVRQNLEVLAVPTTSSGILSASVYAKAAEHTKGMLKFVSTSAPSEVIYCSFDLVAKTVGFGAANSAPTTGLAGTITELTNGWFRITVSGTMGAKIYASYFIALRDESTGNESYTGDGTAGMYFWGSQLEESPAPTAFIDYDYNGETASLSAAVNRLEDVVLTEAETVQTNFVSQITEAALRTNLIPNSQMVGAGVGVFPNGWGINSVTGITVAVTGTGTEDGNPYVDVRFSGTNSNGVTVYPNIVLTSPDSSGPLAVQNQSFAASCYYKIVSGGAQLITLSIRENTLAGGFLATSDNERSITQSTAYTYVTVNRTMVSASTGRTGLWIFKRTLAGESYDFTIRISRPQLEHGLVPSSYIPTYGTVASDGAGDRATPALTTSVSYTEAIQRTNLVPNSTATGGSIGVIGSGGVVPTGWNIPTFAGLTREITALSSEYIDVRFSGTNTSGTTQYPGIYPGPSVISAAVPGDVFTISGYFALVAGTAPSSGLAWQFDERNSVASLIKQSSVVSLPPLSTPTSFSYYSLTSTVTEAAAVSIGTHTVAQVNNGETFDFTLRLGKVQIEKSSVATEYIPTSGTIVTTGIGNLQSSTLLVDRSITEAIQRTNYIFESTTNNVTIGTIGSGAVYPSSWSWGGATGITVQIVAKGTLTNGNDYMDVRWSGTNTSGATAYIAFYPIKAMQVAAAQNQVWTASAYIELIAGSRASLTTPNVQFGVFETNSSGIPNGITITNMGANGGYRGTATRTFSGATTAYAQMYVDNVIAAGATCDFTLRISAPQLEKTNVATDYIPTYGSPVTTGAGVSQLAGSLFDGSNTETTTVATTESAVATIPSAITEYAQRINLVKNSTMQGGGVGVLPTFWGASAGTGVTISVAGVGVENGYEYIDFQVIGTNTSGVTNYVNIVTCNPYNDPIYSTAQGESFTGSLYLKIVSGGTTAISVSVRETTSASSYLGEGTVTYNVQQGSYIYAKASRTMLNATAGLTNFMIYKTLAVSETVNYTLRISRPQLERGLNASAYIPTYGTAATAGASDLPSTTMIAPVSVSEAIQRTNYTPNSVATGAAAGTPGTSPTNWTTYAPGTNGLSRSIATGIDANTGYSYIDIRIFGTPTATIGGQFVAGFQNFGIPATLGETWTASSYVALVGGSKSGLGNLYLQITGRNSVGGLTETAATNLLQEVGSQAIRYSVSKNVTNAATTTMQHELRFDYTLNVPVDFTARVFAPQLEESNVMTEYIPVTGTTVGSTASAGAGTLQSSVATFTTDRTEAITRTNHVLNSVAAGAVTGTPGTMPTNWSISASGGMSYSVVSTGTQEGLPYVDIRFFGTPSSPTTAYNGIGFTTAAAVVGENWTSSAYASLVSGSILRGTFQIRELTSGGGYLAGTSISLINNALGTQLRRISVSKNFVNVSVAKAEIWFEFPTLIGDPAIDFTVRIAAPQLERSNVMTEYIPTTTAVVTTGIGVLQSNTTAFNVSDTETSSANESATNILTKNVDNTETSTSTDSSSNTAIFVPTITETSLVTDANTNTATMVGSRIEITVADANQNGGFTVNMSTVEYDDVIDVPSTVLSTSSDRTETVSATDVESSTADIGTTATETGNASESNSALRGVASAVTESGDAIDAATTILFGFASTVETLTVLDLPTATYNTFSSIVESSTLSDKIYASRSNEFASSVTIQTAVKSIGLNTQQTTKSAVTTSSNTTKQVSVSTQQTTKSSVGTKQTKVKQVTVVQKQR